MFDRFIQLSAKNSTSNLEMKTYKKPTFFSTIKHTHTHLGKLNNNQLLFATDGDHYRKLKPKQSCRALS